VEYSQKTASAALDLVVNCFQNCIFDVWNTARFIEDFQNQQLTGCIRIEK
jgi:hypothetical protein